MTTTESRTMAVKLLDPRELTTHPRNVRTALGDLAGLTASIAAQGVIEPLTVVPIDGGHQIVAGHRRAAAAIAAELDRVPCVVRHDLAAGDDDQAGQAVHVGTMLAENLHREGLTAVEEARGVQSMLDLGVPISKVAKSTGLDQKRVKKAIGVSRLDDVTAAVVIEHQLDLDTAAAIALYADEPELAAELAGEAARGPGFLAHALGRAKKDRDARRAADKLRSALLAAGRTIVDDFEHTGSRNRMVSGLLGPDGLSLDQDAHVTCPGSAVYIRTEHWSGTIAASEVCTAPFDHGHRDRYGSASVSSSPAETPEEKDAAAAERREVIANNKAMAAANTVRRAWLREFLSRRTAPKELLRFAVEAIADRPDAMHTWLSGSGTQEAADAVRELGLTRPSRWVKSDVSLTNGEQVPDARLPLQLFGHVGAAVEGSIGKDSWRSKDHDREHLVSWLTFLAGQGYTLSDVEQGIVDGAGK